MSDIILQKKRTESTEKTDVSTVFLHTSTESSCVSTATTKMLELFTDVEFDLICCIVIAVGTRRSVFCMDPTRKIQYPR